MRFSVVIQNDQSKCLLDLKHLLNVALRAINSTTHQICIVLSVLTTDLDLETLDIQSSLGICTRNLRLSLVFTNMVIIY